jgi:hypothetical protein
MEFSGIPHKPNPPSMITDPSLISCIASAALEKTLFILIRELGDKNTV